MRVVCALLLFVAACEYQTRGLPDDEDPVELEPDAAVEDPTPDPPEPPTMPPDAAVEDPPEPTQGDAEFGEACEVDLDCEDPESICARVRGEYICTYACERKQDCPDSADCGEESGLCFPTGGSGPG